MGADDEQRRWFESSVDYGNLAGVVRPGGRHLYPGGLDLLGVVVGSEGLLGVVTEVTVRILPRPETARAVLVGFPDAEQAGACVAQVIAQGSSRHGNDGPARDPCGGSPSSTAGAIRSMWALLIVEDDGPRRMRFPDCALRICWRATGAVTLRVLGRTRRRWHLGWAQWCSAAGGFR
jgi:glycolate oxidase